MALIEYHSSPLIRLALITQQYTVSQDLNVAYVVVLHIWMAFCILFTFCCLVEYAVAIAYAHHIDERNAADAKAKAAMPLTPTNTTVRINPDSKSL